MALDKGSDRADSRLMNWNVRGLNQPVKKSRVFSQLNELKSEILYLQETNLLNKDQAKLCRGGFTHVFHSDSGNKSRGVTILLHQHGLFKSLTS